MWFAAALTLIAQPLLRADRSFTSAAMPTQKPTSTSTPLAVEARELGTFTLGTPSQPCPVGFTCNNFTVTCPALDPITGTIADQKPTVQPRGLVMFFSGDTGTDLWSNASPLIQPFFQSLLDQGYELVQVAWGDNGWLVSVPGVQSGQEVLACRPATAIQWVHDNLAQGRFCITGNSGGAAQITYAISSYGVAADVVVPTSGPPMAALSKGCLEEPGYGYDPNQCSLIDVSYGSNTGPCVAHDQTFTDTWIANSVETGGTQYNYPATKVHIIIGGQDNVIIGNHANDYFQVLVQAQQPMLTWQVVPFMGHEITLSADGLAALFTALTESIPTPTPSTTPAATATVTPTGTATPVATPTATSVPSATPTPTPTPSVTPTATPSPTPRPATLGNISTRLQVGTGANVLIAGFIVQGSAPKRVLIRAIGPSLTQFGVPNALANPRLELHDISSTIGMNDDWQTTQIGGVITADQVAEIQNSGLAPSDPLESALIATLSPGSYTAIVQGVNNGTGVGSVEVYDLDASSGSFLDNIATRGFVQRGDNAMIGGFIVVTQPTRVIIRAIGPSLSQFGVPDVLANPQLELHDLTSIIGRNDDWQTTQLGGIITSDQVAEIQNSQLAPTSAAESAIIATLPVGSYTAIVRGVNDTTGNALVEVYSLQ
jgi:hypothetical protein